MLTFFKLESYAAPTQIVGCGSVKNLAGVAGPAAFITGRLKKGVHASNSPLGIFDSI